MLTITAKKDQKILINDGEIIIIINEHNDKNVSLVFEAPYHFNIMREDIWNKNNSMHMAVI